MDSKPETRRYELAEDVNSVRVGSLLIGPEGYETSNRREFVHLDEHPGVVRAKKPAAKPREQVTPA